MSRIIPSSSGVTIVLDHSEVQTLASAEDLAAGVLGIVGANVHNPIVDAIIAVLVLFIQTEKSVLVGADQGSGVRLVLNWLEVALAGPIALRTITRTAAEAEPPIDLFVLNNQGNALLLEQDTSAGPGNLVFNWSPVSNGTFSQGTLIGAVQRNATQDLYAIGQDWTTYSAWRDGGGQWAGWSQLFPDKFNPGTPITAMALTPNNVNLFAVSQDGQVWSAWWDGANWNRWVTISQTDGVKFRATQIAGVMPSQTHVDLYAVDQDGIPRHAAWDAASGWSSWEAIGGWQFTGKFGPLGLAAPLTAVVRGDVNQVHLFLVTGDGRMSTWDSKNWSNISDGRFLYGSPVAVAMSRSSYNLFAVDAKGIVQWSSTQNGLWSPIGTPGDLVPGSPVTAVARTVDRMDLFVTARDGKIYSAYETAGNWSQWYRIAGPDFGGGFCPPGAAITVPFPAVT